MLAPLRSVFFILLVASGLRKPDSDTSITIPEFTVDLAAIKASLASLTTSTKVHDRLNDMTSKLSETYADNAKLKGRIKELERLAIQIAPEAKGFKTAFADMSRAWFEESDHSMDAKTAFADMGKVGNGADGDNASSANVAFADMERAKDFWYDSALVSVGQDIPMDNRYASYAEAEAAVKAYQGDISMIKRHFTMPAGHSSDGYYGIAHGSAPSNISKMMAAGARVNAVPNETELGRMRMEVGKYTNSKGYPKSSFPGFYEAEGKDGKRMSDHFDVDGQPLNGQASINWWNEFKPDLPRVMELSGIDWRHART